MGALTNTQRQLLVCLAARVVPESASMAGSPRAQMLSLIDEALAARPPAMQRQFGLFLIVLRWAPLLRYLRPLDRLDPRRQATVLRWFQDCPFQTVRSGFWGVRTLIFIGYYGRPDVGNRVMVDREGHPVVRYAFTDGVKHSLVQAMRASARVFFAAGAARVHAPASSRFFIDAADADRIDELIPFDGLQLGKVTISSAHPMGGCRMGASPDDSVTDAWGQVHGLPWLFVADASLFPRCAEINPYVTIMALADRVAERVRREWPQLRAHAS